MTCVDAISGIRAAYESEMLDTCVILSRTETQDSLGEVISTYVAGAEMPCMFSQTAAKETRRADATIAITVAKLRLPVGTAVTRRDRVRIVARFGATLTDPLEYDVEGDPLDTVAFRSCGLAKVTM